MARGSQSSASMTEICNYNGTRFANIKEQKTFIRTHFGNSFKKPEDEPDDLSGCIENFSGEQIIEHSLVKNLKLNEDEKLKLEQGFTPEELDTALERANNNSAPGIDGCAAKAFYSCPAIISHRPRSQNTSKEPQLNSEKDSRRKQARSHVTLEKSS